MEGNLFTSGDFMDGDGGLATIDDGWIILSEAYFDDAPMSDGDVDIASHEGYHNEGKVHADYGDPEGVGMFSHVSHTCFGRPPAPWAN